jgi:B9 domain-containing protein 1
VELDAQTRSLLREPPQGQDNRALTVATRDLLGERSGAPRQRRVSLEREERERAAAEAEPTCFRLVLGGEVESAQMGTGNRGPLMCVFSFTHGPDWTVVSGAHHGVTQLATSAVPLTSSIAATLRGGGVREVVWNFPIGLVLKSTSPFGWPRIAVVVYGTDMCNRRVVKGYGSVHIPCQPGRHERTVRLYCPLSSSPFTRLMGWLAGNPAQLVDHRVITGVEGREVVRVQSGGKLRLVFEVLLKDTDAFNYSF